MDVELVTKAINGDDDAFLLVMQNHRDVLYKTAYIYLKNENDVVEALQEVTYRAYRKRYHVKEARFFQTWLIRILLNYCMDLLRKQGKVILKPERTDDVYLTDELIFELDEAIQNLSIEQQELIHLKYFKELTTRDVATKLAIPEGTVKSRLHHKLKKMRLFLSERGGDA